MNMNIFFLRSSFIFNSDIICKSSRIGIGSEICFRKSNIAKALKPIANALKSLVFTVCSYLLLYYVLFASFKAKK